MRLPAHRPGLVPLLLGAGCALLVLSACGRPPETREDVPVLMPAGPRPDSEQWEAVISLFESGRKQAVIEARYMALFQLPERNYTHMDTLEVDFFNTEGVRSSHLVARAGEIYNQDRAGRRRVKTWGDVILTAEEEREVRADTLWWDEARDRVYTFGPFEMMREGEFIQGAGLEADTRLDEYRFIDASGWSEQGGEWLDAETDSTATASSETTTSAPPDTTLSAPPDTTLSAPPDTTLSAPSDPLGIPPEDRPGPVLPVGMAMSRKPGGS